MCHHPDEVWLRYGFSRDEPLKKIKIIHDNPRLPTSTPDQSYQSPLKLDSKKVKDLIDVASKFIPEPWHQFYLQMNGVDSSEDEGGLSDDEDA